MRHIFVIFLWVISFHAQGQVLKGTVTDGLSGAPLYPATVANLNTHMATYTNEEGNYTLTAKAGDTIQISFIGYSTYKRIAPPALGTAILDISLLPMETQLPMFTVRSLSKYQQDSMKMQQLYADELGKVVRKPSIGFNNGVSFNGLISSLTHKLSKDYKQGKHFMNSFETFEQNKFIDTRYTQDLVNHLTGFTGDTLVTFMNAHPMPYDYARTASDLEIKMWIRYNYRQYMHQQKQEAQKPRSAQ